MVANIPGLFLRKDKEDWEVKNLFYLATKSNDFKYKANRWLEEAEDLYRTSFQRDVGRILYSNAFRRLRTKTQVFCDPNTQHNRTRLTHTVEVAHLSRQVARTLRLNEDLTEAIALGHDLGHTPFGHAGERALNDCLSDKGGFSHNAQSVWVVEKFNHNRQINGRCIPGLNLTYGVKEGILKHTKLTTNLNEYEKFHPEDLPTLEGQVVNICDTLAYLYHDIDDGIRNSFINKDEVKYIWSQNTDLDYNRWYHHLINDLVNNSFERDVIKFSDGIEKTIKALKELLKEKVIMSGKIMSADNKAYELVCSMYEILINNHELIPDNKDNKYKMDNFGAANYSII
ncbi:dNTP triphosphohydrolase [Peptococcaceae bacterium 1198_IL3148]